MPESGHEHDLIVSRFGHRPTNTSLVIPVRRPKLSEPLVFAEEDCVSSLGYLESLPAELLHHVLELLDFQSLARTSASCRVAYRYIHAYPAFRELRKHAPETIVALRRSELADLHAASKIYAALTSPACACCANFGAFLFLPSGQRCCFTCMRDCRRFRLIACAWVAQALRLSRQQTDNIPQIRVIPGTYPCGVWSNTRLKGMQLVGLASAIESIPSSTAADATDADAATDVADEGIKVQKENDGDHCQSVQHGSGTARSSANSHGNNININISSQPTRVSEELRSLTERLGFYRCTAGTEANNDWPPNEWLGMGSISFPHLDQSSGTIDQGVWCKGCWHAGHAKSLRRMTGGNRLRAKKTCLEEVIVRRHIMDIRLQPAMSDEGFVDRLKHQERSRSDFVEHASCCPCLDFKWAWDDHPALASLRERLISASPER